jgi:hypothetical protein
MCPRFTHRWDLNLWTCKLRPQCLCFNVPLQSVKLTTFKTQSFFVIRAEATVHTIWPFQLICLPLFPLQLAHPLPKFMSRAWYGNDNPLLSNRPLDTFCMFPYQWHISLISTMLTNSFSREQGLNWYTQHEYRPVHIFHYSWFILGFMSIALTAEVKQCHMRCEINRKKIIGYMGRSSCGISQGILLLMNSINLERP